MCSGQQLPIFTIEDWPMSIARTMVWTYLSVIVPLLASWVKKTVQNSLG